MRNAYCSSWIMAKKKKNLKNVENEKCTLQDMEYGKKTENLKNQKSTLQDQNMAKKKLKNVENEKRTLQDFEYGQKTGKRERMRKANMSKLNIARKTEKLGK